MSHSTVKNRIDPWTGKELFNWNQNITFPKEAITEPKIIMLFNVHASWTQILGLKGHSIVGNSMSCFHKWNASFWILIRPVRIKLRFFFRGWLLLTNGYFKIRWNYNLLSIWDNWILMSRKFGPWEDCTSLRVEYINSMVCKMQIFAPCQFLIHYIPQVKSGCTNKYLKPQGSA